MDISINLLEETLLSFATGDAMGMGTEFMTRQAINERFGVLDGFIKPLQSQNHSDLASASVTDDTEQVLALLKAYGRDGLSVQVTVETLVDWINTSDAVAKRYIGPSTLSALKAVQAGGDWHVSGVNGTTCGGIMRSPAPAIYSVLRHQTEQELAGDVYACLVATHNTSQAMEAAMAYAYALVRALRGASIDDIISDALRGAMAGRNLAPYEACAASTHDRILFLRSTLGQSRFGVTEFLDYIYGVMGTSLASEDVAAAVFALFIYTEGDAWKAIRLASSLGGDTDTIAALAGALCTAYAQSSDIPDEVKETVVKVNNLDIHAILESVAQR